MNFKSILILVLAVNFIFSCKEGKSHVSSISGESKDIPLTEEEIKEHLNLKFVQTKLLYIENEKKNNLTCKEYYIFNAMSFSDFSRVIYRMENKSSIHSNELKSYINHRKNEYLTELSELDKKGLRKFCDYKY